MAGRNAHIHLCFLHVDDACLAKDTSSHANQHHVGSVENGSPALLRQSQRLYQRALNVIHLTILRKWITRRLPGKCYPLKGQFCEAFRSIGLYFGLQIAIRYLSHDLLPSFDVHTALDPFPRDVGRGSKAYAENKQVRWIIDGFRKTQSLRIAGAGLVSKSQRLKIRIPDGDRFGIVNTF